MKEIFLLCMILASGQLFSSEAKLDVPLLPIKSWLSLSYKKIKKNQIEFIDNRILIKVDQSASPLFYTFKAPQKFRRIKVIGKASLGQLNKARSKRAEDFPFQVGLVYSGKKTLPWYKKVVAPEWVKQLFALAPEGMGLDYVHFLGVSRSQNELEEKDVVMRDGLIRARVVTHLKTNGQFVLDFETKSDHPVLALWLHSDGDNEQLSYQVEVQSIRLYK